MNKPTLCKDLVTSVMSYSLSRVLLSFRILKLFSFKFLFFVCNLFLTLSLTSCTNTGIQGGDLKNRFNGVSKSTALSPTSIQLEWSLDSRYSAFNIYTGGADTPLKKETFSQTIINNLNPNTTYGFTVTGINSNGTGTEDGFEKVTQVSTLNSFTGLNSSSLAGVTNNSIKWKFNTQSAVVSYKLFSIKRNGTWDFSNPIDSQSDATAVTLTASSLAGGTTYCFFVIAQYADGTSEPSTKDLSAVNKSAPCAATENGIPPADVVMNSTIPGTFPWFNITGGADINTTVEIRLTKNDQLIASRKGTGELRSSVSLPPGLNQFYSITSTAFGKATKDIVLEPTPPSSRSTGAYIRSLVDDRNDDKGPLYPLLINSGKGIQNLGSKIVKGDFNCDGIPDVAIAAPTSTPFGDPDPAKKYIDPNHRIKTGAVLIYYGKKTKTFDQNGLNPVVSFSLNIDGVPLPNNSAPSPQVIYFPMDSSNTNLGYQMAVGNINGDCQDIGEVNSNGDLVYNSDYCDSLWSIAKNPGQGDLSQHIPSADNIITCDDLAVSSKESNGAVYVFYGNSINGLTTASGSKTYGTNDLACVANGACQAMRYTPTGTHAVTNESFNSVTNFGKALVFGDFNNDGFDDLAISSDNSGKGEIFVLGGSASGLYPANQNPIPNISQDNVSTNGNKIILAQTSGNNFSDKETGFSLATAFDSRVCQGFPSDSTTNINTNGFRSTLPVNNGNNTNYPAANTALTRLKGFNYDFSKCDDLIIGSPNVQSNRGSIFSCAAVLDNSNPHQINKWACQEHVPLDPNTGSPIASGSLYGYAVIGIKNFNSYPMDNFRSIYDADIAGSVFVGAPGYNSNVGRIFGYYITPNATAIKNTNTDASGIGGIQMILSEATSSTISSGINQITATHTIQAQNSVACNADNNDVSLGTKWWALPYAVTGTNSSKATGSSSCFNQFVDMNPALSNAHFGSSFGVIPDIDANNSTASRRSLNYEGAPLLAVSAPYSTVLSSDGVTNYIEHGLVLVYKLDVSNPSIFSSNYPTYVSGAPYNKFIYGGGLNPFGPAPLYARDQTHYSHFGLGGIVGGYFNEDKSFPFTQVIAGSEGNNPGGFTSNGSVSTFKTLTKQLNFVEQKCSGTCPTNVKNLEINYNTSIETSYHFETAQVVGDLNGDGYDDVVARSVTGDQVTIAVYYGSASGLVRTPAPSKLATGLQPLLLSFSGDPMMGIQFAKIGSVNGDSFDDLLLVGANGAYIYYGSFAGLVANTDPASAPNGTYPLWFGKSDSTSAYKIYASSSGGSLISDISENTFENNSYSFANNSIAAEDFNGDGYFDIAIGVKDSSTKNSILIFYGGPDGLQVNRTDHAGLIQAGDLVTWTPTYSSNSSNCPTPGGLGVGCTYWSSNSNSVCLGGTCQILRIEGVDSRGFATTMTSLPPDKSADANNKFGNLVVSDLNTTISPNFSNIYIFTGTATAMRKPLAIPVVNMNASNVITNRMDVTQMAYAGDVNGDKIPDLLITSSNDSLNNNTAVRVLYGQSGSVVNYSTSQTTGFSVLNFVGSTSTVKYGLGLGTAGDFNTDGYDDILINVPRGNNSSSTTTISQTGYVIVVFGSAQGVRKASAANAVATPSITPKCYGGAANSASCEPYLIYLPSSKASEFTYVSSRSTGDINGDGISDILIGGFGRNNIYGNGYATGVVYVMY